jgi:predicted metalloprotease with PDZ domain
MHGVWNGLRPVSLEPFDFEEANMSGALWFAEGFTSYYTNLILARAGVITPDEYVEGLARTLNYVMLSPGSQFFNPIEMSYRAPFVDAATAIDPDNNANIFISYYSYGSLLGLALDLTLRTEAEASLDEYMRTLWQQYGRNEQPYSIKDLESTLATLAGDSLAQAFFARHIYSSEMPNMQRLLSSVGVQLALGNENEPYLGPSTRWIEADRAYEISTAPQMGSPAYEAGLRLGDRIMSVDGLRVEANRSPASIIEAKRVGQQVEIAFTRWGMSKSVNVQLKANPRMKTERVRRLSRAEAVAFGEWIPVGQ